MKRIMAKIICPTCGKVLGYCKGNVNRFVFCKKCKPIAIDKIEQKMGKSFRELIRMEEIEL